MEGLRIPAHVGRTRQHARPSRHEDRRAAHKKKFEEWLRATFAEAGIAQASQLARQILLLLDGSFAVVLLHRDPSYMETAGEAAHALIEAALPVRVKRRPR